MTMTPRRCELEIRSASDLDVEAIQQVAREAWDRTYAGLLGDFDRREIRGHMYSERALREDIVRHGSHFFVATVKDTVVGFGEMVVEGSAGEVVRIAVRPAWQRQGIATALLCRGLAILRAEGAEEVTAGIEREDEPARSFFESHGFRRVNNHARGTPRELRSPAVDLLEFARPVGTEAAPSPGAIEVWCDDGGRFCPRCRRRYPDGVARCELCGISLVAEVPETRDNEEHRFVPVLRTADASRIALISSALEGSEIAFSVHEESGPDGVAEVWVAPGRVSEARDVLERLDESAVTVEDE